MLRLKARIRKWKAKRKLKKSGWSTWRAYKHNNDPGVARYARLVEDFYVGYKYFYACPNPSHYAYELLADYGPGGQWFGYEEMNEWCHEKIMWNFRCDCLRVYEDYWGQMVLNELGDSDIIYFAFKRKKDFTHFLLRWS